MKIIFGNTFLKQAENYNITIDDLENRLEHHFHSCLPLCSPLPDTTIYKGYYSGVERIIMFHKTTNGLLIPVYIGDKHDPITKNIISNIVKQYADKRFDIIIHDLEHHTYKIRHIKT